MQELFKIINSVQGALSDMNEICEKELRKIEQLKSFINGLKIRKGKFLNKMSSRIGDIVFLRISYENCKGYELISGTFTGIRQSEDYPDLIYLTFSIYKELTFDEDENRYNEFRIRENSERSYDETCKYEFITEDYFKNELKKYKENI